jgi:hypothetical protein
MASKSKRNKTKFKWTKELVFLIVGILALIAATIIINIPKGSAVQLEKYNKAISDYNSKNNAQYSFIPEENVLKETKINGISKKKKSNDYTFVFYGSLANAEFLENLSKVNNLAKEYDVKSVYLWFADYVEKADDDLKATATYKNKVDEYNSIINENINSLVESSNGLYMSQDNFDLETYPALLVFKSDSLVFNSQTYSKSEDSAEYSWDTYINTAFKFAKADKVLTTE